VYPGLTVACLLIFAPATPALGAGMSSVAPARADSAVAASLREQAAAKRFEAMRWPDVSDARASMRGLYEASGWQPLFLDSLGQPTAATRALVQRLLALDAHGLNPADFNAGVHDSLLAVLERGNAGWTPAELAAFDARLVVDAIRYAAAMRYGRARLRWIDDTVNVGKGILTVRRAPMDVGEVITTVRMSPEPATVLFQLEDRSPSYRQLQAALVRYRTLAADSSLTALPPLPARLAPGQSYAGAAALRRLLVALGDLPDTLPVPPVEGDTLYDATLVRGVKHLQQRENLTPPDGIIAKNTAARLANPFGTPVRAIIMTMERMRALPAPPVDSLWIRVNIPEFRMRVMVPDSEGAPPVAMNVVVGGRGRNETPELASTLGMIVFSPTWRVPPRIIRDEIVPKALGDSMYLTRQGMELVRKGQVVPATPENLALVGDSIGVRQRPGDVNALGTVKFIFPNPYGVYLHDTPTKATFRRANRAESHGCVRLADASSLATWLLRSDSAWTAERMKKAMASPKPIDVTLGQGVPVRLVYETAVPREDGGVDFIADVYGRDRNMELALQQGYPYPSKQVPLVKKK
jgi:murein L,D-transpeptidase YcbB/YkuD